MATSFKSLKSVYHREIFALCVIIFMAFFSIYYLHLPPISLAYYAIGFILLLLLINNPVIALFTDLIFVFILVGLSADLYSTWSYKAFTFVSILALIINRIYKQKDILLGSASNYILYIGFIVFTLISSMVNQVTGTYNYLLVLLTKFSIVFLIVNLIGSRRTLMIYFIGFIVVGTINNIVGILQVILGLDWYGFGPRAIGFLVNPNGVGYLHVLLIPIIFILMAQTKNKKYRVILMLLFILCPITAILSQSRGALLATFIVMAGVFITSIRNYYMFIMIIIVSLLVAVFWQEPYTERFRSTLERKDILEESRGYLYRAAVLMIVEHPILGVGPGRFGAEFVASYSARINAPFKRSFVPHNGYFEVMLTAGIPGMLLILALIGLWIRRYYRSSKYAKGINDNELYQLCVLMIISTIGYMIVAAFETLIEAKNFYYYLGLNLAIMNIIAKEKRDRDIIIKQNTINSSIKTPAPQAFENT